MAGFEQKNMSGVLFKNDRKEQEKHPDRKGEALIDGKSYWVAGWLKDGKNGQFLSLAFTPKDEKSTQPRREPPKDDPFKSERDPW